MSQPGMTRSSNGPKKISALWKAVRGFFTADVMESMNRRSLLNFVRSSKKPLNCTRPRKSGYRRNLRLRLGQHDCEHDCEDLMIALTREDWRGGRQACHDPIADGRPIA